MEEYLPFIGIATAVIAAIVGRRSTFKANSSGEVQPSQGGGGSLPEFDRSTDSKPVFDPFDFSSSHDESSPTSTAQFGIPATVIDELEARWNRDPVDGVQQRNAIYEGVATTIAASSSIASVDTEPELKVNGMVIDLRQAVVLSEIIKAKYNDNFL